MLQKQTLAILLFFIAFMLGGEVCFSQASETHQQAQDIVNQAIKVYGPDDLIERGLIYIPKNPRATGHPYLTDNDWNTSSISILEKEYNDYEVKYDVCHNHIILKKPLDGTNVYQPIVLQNSLIDIFTMGKYNFTNLSQVDSLEQLSGFAEVLYSGDLLFYKTYYKEFINQYSQSNPFGFYSKLKSDFYLFQEGQKTKINNRKSLLKYFKEIQKPLKKQMRKEHFRFKDATSSEFYEIMKLCEELLSDIPD